MPSPAIRAHRALLAVLAAMAILTGLLPAALIRDRGLPVAATATHRRPDDDDDGDDTTDDSDQGSDDDDADTGDEDSDDDDSSDDSDTDQVDEDKLPDNVKAILKKNRKELRDARRELKQLRRAKPAAKPKPKAKPAAGDNDQDDQPSEREAKATHKLRRANLITALSKSKHGLVDPAAAAKLALQDGLADFDDDDEPTDLDDLVESLVDEYSFLKGETPKARPKPAPNIDGGNGQSKKAPKLSAAQLEAAKAANMTPEKYAALLHGGNLDDWEKTRPKTK